MEALQRNFTICLTITMWKYLLFVIDSFLCGLYDSSGCFAVKSHVPQGGDESCFGHCGSKNWSTIQPRSLWDWRIECLTRWSGAQEHHRDCTLTVPFHTSDTSDIQHKSDLCHLQKYSDDSAVVGCLWDGQEVDYRELVDHFVAWCGDNDLILDVNKTNEMIVDFRRNRVISNPISCMGEKVEVVEEYK